ncbi:MAG: hypothetical protein ACT4TC_03330 [Myxococcaceae bacterium]
MGSFLTLFAVLSAFLGMLRPELRVLLCMLAFLSLSSGVVLRVAAHFRRETSRSFRADSRKTTSSFSFGELNLRRLGGSDPRGRGERRGSV